MAGVSPIPSEGRLGGWWALKNLVVAPALAFLRAFFMGGNFFKTGPALFAATREWATTFGVNSRRYEIANADKRELDAIRDELSRKISGG